jgi:hypothetical protein
MMGVDLRVYSTLREDANGWSGCYGRGKRVERQGICVSAVHHE